MLPFAFGQGPQVVIPGVPGVVPLPPAAYASLPAAAVGIDGLASQVEPIPEAPALLGSSLPVQELAASPSGALSIPAATVLALALGPTRR